jgi:predicted nucleic acid-binding protein
MKAHVGTLPRHVLVDSSAWFALSHRRDANYPRAQIIVSHLAANRRILLTTNFVIAEAHALLMNRGGRPLAWHFLRRVTRDGEVALVRVTEAHERRALEVIETYDDKDFSYTDATSFAIMERLGIAEAFSFDRHFVQYGLCVLGLEQ